jgi:hypothetical protein
MPVFSSDEMVTMIQELWRHDTSLTIDKDIVEMYFGHAVRHVETFDYPKDNEYAIVTDKITFTTTPSNISFMLYAYKALELIQAAALNGEISDNKLGVSWRSGMESISTSTAGKIKELIKTDFQKKYRDALNRARIRGHQPTRFDIYDDL